MTEKNDPLKQAKAEDAKSRLTGLMVHDPEHDDNQRREAFSKHIDDLVEGSMEAYRNGKLPPIMTQRNGLNRGQGKVSVDNMIRLAMPAPSDQGVSEVRVLKKRPVMRMNSECRFEFGRNRFADKGDE